MEDRAGLVESLQDHERPIAPATVGCARPFSRSWPRDGEDWRLVSALLGERSTLRIEIERRKAALTGADPSLLE